MFTLSVILQQQSIHKKSWMRSSSATQHYLSFAKLFLEIKNTLPQCFWMKTCFLMGFLYTKEAKEGCHLLRLDDNSWRFGHFGTIHLIPALVLLVLPCWTLAIGSFDAVSSFNLKWVWSIIRLDPDSNRGGSVAPPSCILHHATIQIICMCSERKGRSQTLKLCREGATCNSLRWVFTFNQQKLAVRGKNVNWQLQACKRRMSASLPK